DVGTYMRDTTMGSADFSIFTPFQLPNGLDRFDHVRIQRKWNRFIGSDNPRVTDVDMSPKPKHFLGYFMFEPRHKAKSQNHNGNRKGDCSGSHPQNSTGKSGTTRCY